MGSPQAHFDVMDGPIVHQRHAQRALVEFGAVDVGADDPTIYAAGVLNQHLVARRAIFHVGLELPPRPGNTGIDAKERAAQSQA